MMPAMDNDPQAVAMPKPVPGWRRFLGNGQIRVSERRPVGIGMLLMRPPFRVHTKLASQLAARRNAALMRGDRVRLRGRDVLRLAAHR